MSARRPPFTADSPMAYGNTATPPEAIAAHHRLVARERQRALASELRAQAIRRARIGPCWRRTGALICRSYPLAPGPVWRNQLGYTFDEGVSDWLRAHAKDFAGFDESELDPVSFDAYRGCGLYLPERFGEPACFLVTLAAMTACVVEQGLEAVPPAMLNHALMDLVDAGHLAPQVEVCELGSMGLVWCYVLRDPLDE